MARLIAKTRTYLCLSRQSINFSCEQSHTRLEQVSFTESANNASTLSRSRGPCGAVILTLRALQSAE